MWWYAFIFLIGVRENELVSCRLIRMSVWDGSLLGPPWSTRHHSHTEPLSSSISCLESHLVRLLTVHPDGLDSVFMILYGLNVSFNWTGRQQGQHQTGRGRNSRRRPASNFQMDVFDDSQGNNYEVWIWTELWFIKSSISSNLILFCVLSGSFSIWGATGCCGSQEHFKQSRDWKAAHKSVRSSTQRRKDWVRHIFA